LGLTITSLMCITTGTLYQKRFVAPCDVRTASAVQLMAALLVTWPLAALETEAIQWVPPLIGALAWSVLALSLGASSLLYLMIQRGAAAAVTSLMYLVPPSTAFLAGEAPGAPAPVFQLTLAVAGGGGKRIASTAAALFSVAMA
jgi:drug/metabolite transporter (DMT)-like permease